MTDYERDTRHAYQTRARAMSYRDYQQRDWSWGRLSTVMEQRALRRMMRPLLHPDDLVLDMPCGTGILAPLLTAARARVVAADISTEMMALALETYAATCVAHAQADITALPFRSGSIDTVMTIGFMHRVPPGVRRAALQEIARVSRRFAIVSFSLDSPLQRVKHAVLRAVTSRHVPAPSPAHGGQVEAEIRAAGCRVAARVAILPWLSAEWLYLIEKTEPPA